MFEIQISAIMYKALSEYFYTFIAKCRDIKEMLILKAKICYHYYIKMIIKSNYKEKVTINTKTQVLLLRRHTRKGFRKRKMYLIEIL